MKLVIVDFSTETIDSWSFNESKTNFIFIRVYFNEGIKVDFSLRLRKNLILNKSSFLMNVRKS